MTTLFCNMGSVFQVCRCIYKYSEVFRKVFIVLLCSQIYEIYLVGKMNLKNSYSLI